MANTTRTHAVENALSARYAAEDDRIRMSQDEDERHAVIDAGIDLDDFVLEHGEDLVAALSAPSEIAPNNGEVKGPGVAGKSSVQYGDAFDQSTNLSWVAPCVAEMRREGKLAFAAALESLAASSAIEPTRDAVLDEAAMVCKTMAARCDVSADRAENDAERNVAHNHYCAAMDCYHAIRDLKGKK